MDKKFIENNADKESFLNNLCNEIKYKKVHPIITKEIENHIDELATDLVENGTTVVEAYKIAVHRMGNPKEIGEELNKTYKPMIEWSVIFLTVTLVGIGIFVLTYINNVRIKEFFNGQTFMRTTLLGIVACIVTTFIDYKKLEKISIHCYILLCIVMLFWGTDIGNPPFIASVLGFRFWRDMPFLLMPFLIISFSGITKKLCSGRFKNFAILLVLACIPCFWIIRMPRVTAAIILGVIFLSMITFGLMQQGFNGKRRKYIVGLYGGGFLSLASILGYYYMSFTYRAARLRALFSPTTDSGDNGYQIAMAREFLQSANLFGEAKPPLNNGMASALYLVPNAHNDYIFTAIVATFGWVFAAVLVLLLGCFIWRIMASSRKITDGYGNILTIGICAAFTFQIIMSLLVNMTLLPSTSISLPFISYGGSSFVCNMILVGLLLNVYSRKNLIIEKEIRPHTLTAS